MQRSIILGLLQFLYLHTCIIFTFLLLYEFLQLPDDFFNLAWKLKAFYNLINANSWNHNSTSSNHNTIVATFPKDSDRGELEINAAKTYIPEEFSVHMVNYFLERSRLHKYINNPIFTLFFSKFIIYYAVFSYTIIYTITLLSFCCNSDFNLKKSLEVPLLVYQWEYL